MKNKSIAFCLACLAIAGVWSIGFAESVEETFKKMFPQIRVEDISETGIKGVYEVVSHNQVGYFAPEPGYLLLGDIVDRNGLNITANRRNELIASKAKSLPLDKALKIGQGKGTIIEFTDPDCPYCRRASAALRQKTDVTRYIFFFPLPMHANAENKVKYIFCSKDKVKAYEQAMQGKLDDQKYDTCRKQEADDLLKIHREAGENMGINSTPYFIVNNKPVSGANMPKIDEALKQK
jgi:thiol:disulfide interchange protein DsbC